MRIAMKVLCLFSIALPLAVAQTPADTDGGWPREVDSGGSHFVIFQPQVDRWKENHIEARSAVTVTREGAATPIFGIVSISANTDVDNESRIVTLEDLKVTSVSFPSAASQQPALLNAIRDSLPEWPHTISLDRLLADLAITQAETAAESVPLKNTPPKIIFSSTPSVLILIDGEPVYRSVEGTRYSRVINTPALLLFDSSAGRFYLDGKNWWMTATSLNGPWSAAANSPSDLDQIKIQLTQDEEKDPHDHSQDQGAVGPGMSPPTVYVSTVPAELLQTRGTPQYSPIPKTQLVYITNTENDIFLDTKTQDYYTLLSGRWFKAKSLNGPWSWDAGNQLPRDFAKIPPESPKGSVLASVPETDQAKEAVIANQVPQTAEVKRSEAKLEVRYDGTPRFSPIERTGMEYAINSDTDVIHAQGRYYACRNAVWFVADSPNGPWVLADFIPAVIYTIPPSSPLFHVRYVHVYGATPEFVYFGYTPGYMGAFVSDGVVVFGTGWTYPAWYGDFYIGWPWTWGFGFHYGYWGGGWLWRPVGYPWWYHNPWYVHRVYYEHWNPHWRPGDREWFRNNVNVFNRWPRNTVVRPAPPRFTRPEQPRPNQPAPPRLGGRPEQPRPNQRGGVQPGQHNDLYAGRDGHVYEHRPNGWYENNNSGNWSKVKPDQRLEQQRQSRSLGEARQNEYHRQGPTSGIPRTQSPRSGGGTRGGRSGKGGRR